MSKHTPGPWHVEPHPGISGRQPLADIRKKGCPDVLATTAFYGWSDERMEANANLIAAAPDMYDALQDALATLKHGKQACARCGWGALVKVHDDAIQHVAETLAKAGAPVEFGSSQNGGKAQP